MDFVKACLTKLGLRVNQDDNTVPSLSRLHLSSMEPSETSGILAGLQEIVTNRDGEEYIKDETDTFHLEKQNTWSLNSLASTLQGDESDVTDQSNAEEDKIVDYNTVVKRIVVHEKDYPAAKETPYFNHSAFYANLQHYQEKSKEDDNKFGNYLLYGEVVTSTNSLLEKYASLSSSSPPGSDL